MTRLPVNSVTRARLRRYKENVSLSVTELGIFMSDDPLPFPVPAPLEVDTCAYPKSV